MSQRIFADTSGFFAAVAVNDIYHEACVAALGPNYSLVTTRLIIVETISLLTKRISPFHARSWFEAIGKDKNLCICEVEPKRLQEAERLWLKHRDKTWDLIDCYSFTTMRHEALSMALTLDQHFRQAGFTTIPEI